MSAKFIVTGIALGLLSLLAPPRAIAQGQSQNGDCELPGPPSCGPWEKLMCPIQTPGLAYPTSFCATVGDGPCLPRLDSPQYTKGVKVQNCTNACGVAYQNQGEITYTVGAIKWEPELPERLTGYLVSTAYVVVTSSDSNLCNGGRVDIGTVTWNVNPMPVGIAAINWEPTVPLQGNWWKDECNLGHTDLKKSPYETIGIGVYCPCGDQSWHVKLTQCAGQFEQGVRLAPGQTNVDAALIAATSDCAALRRMSNSLAILADCVSTNDCPVQNACSYPFESLQSIQAHEDLHLSNIKQACDNAFGALKQAVEAITWPRTPVENCDPAEGLYWVKLSSAYLNAVDSFREAMQQQLIKEGNHDPGSSYKAAQHSVVDPLLQAILARMAALHCN